MTLVEFLLARIAEDESAAERIAATTCEGVESAAEMDYFRFADPDRVLARCAADRRIVALHPIDIYLEWCPTCFSGDFDRLDEPEHEDWPCPTLRALASVYADHPDYDQEWRYLCDRCRAGEHGRCSEPGVCECTEPVDTPSTTPGS